MAVGSKLKVCGGGANDLIKISKKNLENKKEKKIMVTVMSYKNCDKKKIKLVNRDPTL